MVWWGGTISERLLGEVFAGRAESGSGTVAEEGGHEMGWKIAPVAAAPAEANGERGLHFCVGAGGTRGTGGGGGGEYRSFLSKLAQHI